MSVPFLGRRRSSSIKKEFSEKELNELRIAFDLLDRNQDGQVTTREFKIMLNNLGIDLKQNKVDELIRSASHAGKELIDENDFLKFVKQIQDLCDLRNSKDDDEQDLVAAFTVFDMDNDGYITKDELRIAMEMIGEEVSEDQLTHIMEVADTDKDGKINYEVNLILEFAQLLS
ncbi:calcium-binding protein E63-1 isoform X2 [Dendroctonus ponderosae]|uniref:EF-hand domain-containing protein n=1 Tax=Dendroctonus ponderosae TaxID=77166 RepID=A0AAR5QF06_DENPD|nr:calcium-binding protein E63-1 isoform X2 [Dendroctonus ponderosae]XP_019771772.1 calcium-binding protein E63-1 isoform X2 [Dendroctonus ponderosae]